MKLSKIHLSLAVLVLLTSIHSGRLSAQSAFLRGDTNQDSRVDLSDAQTLFGFLFLGGGESVPECEDAADANDDGALDLTDGVRILNFLFLGDLAPAAPGVATCGIDPTEDSLSCHSFPSCNVPAESAPSQVEAASEIRSLESATAVQVRFENNTIGEVELFWVDYQGNEQLYAVLAGGERFTQPTFATHPWLLKQGSAVLGTYVATAEASQSFSVGSYYPIQIEVTVISGPELPPNCENYPQICDVLMNAGDLDGDGRITLSDAFPEADLNGDGTVTLIEVRRSTAANAETSTNTNTVEVGPVEVENTGTLSLFEFAAQQGAFDNLTVSAATPESNCTKKIPTLGGVIEVPCD